MDVVFQSWIAEILPLIANFKENLSIVTHSGIRYQLSMEKSHEWAESQRILGVELLQGRALNRGEIVEEALALFRSTLKVWTEAAHPTHWAKSQVSLGNAMMERIYGDKAKNNGTAIGHFRAALRVWDRGNSPYDWARTQCTLGDALLSLPSGHRDENVKEAVKSYENSLSVWTRQSAPDLWAYCEHRLGSAMRELPTKDHANNIEIAIQHFHNALELIDGKTMQDSWARVHSEIAQTLFERASGSLVNNMKDAIDHFHIALETWSSMGFVKEWTDCSLRLAHCRIREAQQWVNGGNGRTFSESQSSMRVSNEVNGEEKCIYLLNEAMQVLDDTTHVLDKHAQPLQLLQQLRLRADILFFLDRTDEAEKVIEKFIELMTYIDMLSEMMLIERDSYEEEWAAVSDLKVALYLRRGEMPEAFDACEENISTQQLRKIHAGVGLIPFLKGAIIDGFNKTLDNIRGIQSQLVQAQGDPRVDYEEVKQLYLKTEKELRVFVEKAQEEREATMQRIMYRVKDVKKTDDILQYLGENNAMAFYFFVSYGFSEDLHERCRKELHMLCMWNEEMHLYSSDVIIDEEKDVDLGYMFCNPSKSFEDTESREDRMDTEKECMARLGALVGEALYELAAHDLPKRVLVIPHKTIANVPFNSLPIPALSSPEVDENSEDTLGNIITGGVLTVPYLSVCYNLHNNEIYPGDNRLISITCESLSMHEKFDDLLRDSYGGNGIVEKLNMTPKMTLQTFKLMQISAYGAFSGATFSGKSGIRACDKPNETGLHLEYTNVDGRKYQLLTITDIWNLDIEYGRLVILLAFPESNDKLVPGSEEWISISDSFLYAGARNVVSTLWPVHEAVSLLIISKFYSNLREQMQNEKYDPPAEKKTVACCLSLAQKWFRELEQEDLNLLLDSYGFSDLDGQVHSSDFSNWAPFKISGPPI